VITLVVLNIYICVLSIYLEIQRGRERARQRETYRENRYGDQTAFIMKEPYYLKK
jgi:hypothetical protein